LQVQTVGPAPGGATQTTIMEYANIIESAELTTNRFDSPAKLVFSCVDAPLIAEGSSVELMVDGIRMFKGYVFTITENQLGESEYTAYDQLRYLKANASYTFVNMTLAQIIQQIAADFGLTVGNHAWISFMVHCLRQSSKQERYIIFMIILEH